MVKKTWEKKMNKKEKRKKFFWLLGITIVDFLIPDPLPFLDEIILTGWTVYLGSKILR